MNNLCNNMLERGGDISASILTNALSTPLIQSGLGFLAAYRLFDHGLSRFLCLDTHTHGTNPFSYMKISVFGADPNYGGSKIGSCEFVDDDEYLKESKGYFHFFKDIDPFKRSSYTWTDVVCDRFSSYTRPRMHAIISSMAWATVSDRLFLKVPFRVMGAFLGAITPTLKFRYTPQEVQELELKKNLQDDPYYYGEAYRTPDPVTPYRLGVFGSLWKGIDSSTLHRMLDNPKKVITGIAFMAASLWVGQNAYETIANVTLSVAESQAMTASKLSWLALGALLHAF